MLNQSLGAAALAAIPFSAVATADFSATYSNDFSNGGGNHYGTSFITTHNGHNDLQLVSDGQSGTHGTWTTGSQGFATRSLTSFNASFNFSFNTNGNGGLGDGFSFLFGDMSNMSGNRWEGGEWGLNAFSDDGHGMSVGFDTYGGDSGIHARWGSNNLSWTNFGTEWWYHANETNYDAALNDANQGSILIDWHINEGLMVRIDWGGDPIDGYYTAIDTDFFGWSPGSEPDLTGWTFGFAGRNGGIDNDILIDNLNINYNYIPAPGMLALFGIAGLAGRRRRD